MRANGSANNKVVQLLRRRAETSMSIGNRARHPTAHQVSSGTCKKGSHPLREAKCLFTTIDRRTRLLQLVLKRRGSTPSRNEDNSYAHKKVGLITRSEGNRLRFHSGLRNNGGKRPDDREQRNRHEQRLLLFLV